MFRALSAKLRHLYLQRGLLPALPLTITLAAIVGVLAGYGAVIFSWLIELFNDLTVQPILAQVGKHPLWWLALAATPAVGLLAVSWITRRFAPEAEGHGVPEVITAVARHDGVIRIRVAFVKILASAICIGTGGSVGREGPIVQIGSALGSAAGQRFNLSSRYIKVLVAAGAAAGISATFNAPLAGVMFASEIILGSFVIESLTPIVIASVLANVVQQHVGEHGLSAAFPQIHYQFEGAWTEIPSYVLLGLACGLAAVGFTKLLYATEDISKRWLASWWARALVLGAVVGIAGVLFPSTPPNVAHEVQEAQESTELTELTKATEQQPMPPLFGVGYAVVEHALHLENRDKENDIVPSEVEAAHAKRVSLDADAMLKELWWLLPLALLKPLVTSITLAGGGSGGIFAPSLYLGATLGGAFGLVVNLLFPEFSASPGVYAIVGMGAVVAGTTHGVISAILIVYEMTGDYRIILPIMMAAGLSSVVSRLIDRESIYDKKLSRRGESIARGLDMHWLEHVMVRDVMVRKFPIVRHTDNAAEIVRIARANPDIESLPVKDEEDRLIGIIRPEDLHRVLDSDISPQLINAEDITMRSPISVSPAANLLEALRDFGTRDVDTLPVEVGKGDDRRLVGLLLRADVMKRYRSELLRHR